MVPIWTFIIFAPPPPKALDGARNGSWGVDEVSNVMGDAGRAPVVDAYGTATCITAAAACASKHGRDARNNDGEMHHQWS